MDKTEVEIMVDQIKVLAESYACTLIALMKSGFSREEAVQIIAHQGAFKLK